MSKLIISRKKNQKKNTHRTQRGGRYSYRTFNFNLNGISFTKKDISKPLTESELLALSIIYDSASNNNIKYREETFIGTDFTNEEKLKKLNTYEILLINTFIAFYCYYVYTIKQKRQVHNNTTDPKLSIIEKNCELIIKLLLQISNVSYKHYGQERLNLDKTIGELFKIDLANHVSAPIEDLHTGNIKCYDNNLEFIFCYIFKIIYLIKTEGTISKSKYKFKYLGLTSKYNSNEYHVIYSLPLKYINMEDIRLMNLKSLLEKVRNSFNTYNLLESNNAHLVLRFVFKLNGISFTKEDISTILTETEKTRLLPSKNLHTQTIHINNQDKRYDVIENYKILMINLFIKLYNAYVYLSLQTLRTLQTNNQKLNIVYNGASIFFLLYELSKNDNNVHNVHNVHKYETLKFSYLDTSAKCLNNKQNGWRKAILCYIFNIIIYLKNNHGMYSVKNNDNDETYLLESYGLNDDSTHRYLINFVHNIYELMGQVKNIKPSD